MIDRRQQALARMESRAIYQQMFTVEPELHSILQVAISQPPERDRWRAYTILKQMSEPYVGFEARTDELRTSAHYEAMVQAIDELLPLSPDEYAVPVESTSTDDYTS